VFGKIFEILNNIIKSIKRKFNMREDFDSLFNKFFGKKKRLESFDEEQDMQPIDDLIDKLNSFHVVTEDTQNSIYEKDLGEPDEIERYEEGGYVFEKMVWYVNGGTVIKVNMITTPFDVENIYEVEDKLYLQQKLDMAVNEERYEDAVILRDKIKDLEEKDNLDLEE
jgi:hypothetical protein